MEEYKAFVLGSLDYSTKCMTSVKGSSVWICSMICQSSDEIKNDIQVYTVPVSVLSSCFRRDVLCLWLCGVLFRMS